MGYFAVTTMREVKRMSALREAYEKQLADLPKGSIRVKERNDRKYYYLYYRANGKVISDYIGNDSTAVNSLREQLARRKGIENLLKEIKKELVLMNRALGATK
jgi:hypothetical protein